MVMFGNSQAKRLKAAGFTRGGRDDKAKLTSYMLMASISTTLVILIYFLDRRQSCQRDHFEKDKGKAIQHPTLSRSAMLNNNNLPSNDNTKGVSTWTPLHPPPPIGIQEGSGVVVDTERGQEVWFMGGYPNDQGHVTVYSLETKQWSRGPYFAWGLHHVFDAVFLSEGQIIVLGGIVYENGRHFGNDAALIRNIADDFSVPWRKVELPVGGIITCTSLDVDGTYWCYSGDIGDYGDIPFKFFQFKPKTLEITQLPHPPCDSTHIAFLQDLKRGLIYMAGGRERIAPSCNDKLFIYDIQKSKWLEEVITIPFTPMESRVAVQYRGADLGLLIGGQTTHLSQTSDLILQFHFDTRTFVWVDELPMPMYGFSNVLLPNGNYMLHGGSSGVGPRFHRLAWEWNPGSLLQEKHPARYFGKDIEVVYAMCGSLIVTEFLKMKVVAGNTSIPAKWCLEEEAGGQGGPEITPTLTIQFLRDGAMHWLTCDGANVCKLGP